MPFLFPQDANRRRAVSTRSAVSIEEKERAHKKCDLSKL